MIILFFLKKRVKWAFHFLKSPPKKIHWVICCPITLLKWEQPGLHIKKKWNKELIIWNARRNNPSTWDATQSHNFRKLEKILSLLGGGKHGLAIIHPHFIVKWGSHLYNLINWWASDWHHGLYPFYPSMTRHNLTLNGDWHTFQVACLITT
jgi:hypothetical protein